MSTRTGKYNSDIQENRISILPAVIAGMISLFTFIIIVFIYTPLPSPLNRLGLIIIGIAGCFYFGVYYKNYWRSSSRSIYQWINVIIAGVSLGIPPYLVTEEFHYLVIPLVYLVALITSVGSRRGPAYTFCVIVFSLPSLHFIQSGMSISGWITHAALFLASMIIVETIQQLRSISKDQMNRLETINEVSAHVVTAVDPDQLFSLLDEALQKAVKADTYIIGIREGGELRLQTFFDDGSYYQDVQYHLKGSFSGWVIENRTPLFLPDLRKPIKVQGIKPHEIGAPRKSLTWMGVPITGSHVEGVIAIASYRANAFHREDFEMLIDIAHRTGLALERLLLFRESRRQAKELKKAYDTLENTYDQTLAALVSALDARDRDTEGHSKRVCTLAVGLGKTLGFSKEELKILERGSILHDIGKIGVSDAILQKPGPLDDEEWKMMQLHPLIGTNIVEGIVFLEDILPCIRHHQERWNGTGYPDGLRGEEIPLLARVFAIADTFDAITTKRLYRKTIMTTGEALEYLCRNAGILFDPRLVAEFIRLIEQQPELVATGSL